MYTMMHPVQAAPRQSSCPVRRRQCQQMHPVQAAPRQSVIHLLAAMDMDGCTPCRQRRGKDRGRPAALAAGGMHPVQAAPRQSVRCLYRRARGDAPRAGSAEAKVSTTFISLVQPRCTPCRQRTAK